jgi:hypothetical protein
MNTDDIISQCLLSIGEDSSTLAAPVLMTRADILAYMNILYQNRIGRVLKRLTLYSYDGSDAGHTITAGVGTLPTDFLEAYRMYDGTIDDGTLLEQIYDLHSKVEDDADTSQYIIVNNTTFWIYGQTPTTGIEFYYYAKPTALTDSSASSPTALKEEFHVMPFVYEIKKLYALRNDEAGDAYDLEVILEATIRDIEFAHNVNDYQPDKIVDVYGGL